MNDEHKTSTPTSGLPEEAGSVGTARSEPESTVYNFARNPTKLINKGNHTIDVSHEYVHLQ